MTSNSNALYSNEIFRQYLLTMSTNIVWKDTYTANASESDDVTDAYRAEIFVVANRGLLNFSVVKSFPRSVLMNSGISPGSIEACASDKNLIPIAMRDAVVQEYANALTSKNPVTGYYAYYNKVTGKYEEIYTEKNNYYRMLMGLPDVNDTDYVYNSDPRWDTNTPVHLLPYVDRIELEKYGVLQKLIAENPSKKYLKHIGKMSVDYFTARIANRFDMLYHNSTDSSTLDSDFESVYIKCKNMVNAVYYNHGMRNTNNLYDKFLAMTILFMTIQNMQRYYLEADIDRDFYDAESIKLVYDSYGVPFFSEISMNYHRKIAKRINKLISYKGTAQVFLDLFEIFDLGTMSMYSYYLTKRRKIGEDGKPTFIIQQDEHGEDMYDEDGYPIMDPSNYTVQFSKVRLGDDPALAISDNSNDVDYNELIATDPYWIDSSDLHKKINDTQFNYLETKYIGVQTIFDLIKITYENAYVFRMITDNKDITDAMTFRWSDLSITCTVFDLFMYLATLYCKLFSYEGLLNTKLPAIMDTIGYDFNNTIKHIDMMSLSIPEKERLYELIHSITLSDISSLDKTYTAITEIQNIIVKGYSEAKTVEEFNTYRNLYYSLLVSKEITEVYQDPTTGQVFQSFSDVLAYYSPDLMQRFLLLPESEIQSEMTLTIHQLEKIMSTLRYLPFSAGVSSSSMIDSLFRILRFFKSAKAELIGYNVSYRIIERGFNFIKFLDRVMYYSEQFSDSTMHQYVDDISLAKDIIKDLSEVLSIKDAQMGSFDITYTKDYIRTLTDMLKLIIMRSNIDSEKIILDDMLVSFRETFRGKSFFKVHDKIISSHYDILGYKTDRGFDTFVLLDESRIKSLLTHIGDNYTLTDRLKHIEDLVSFENYRESSMLICDFIVSFMDSQLARDFTIFPKDILVTKSIRILLDKSLHLIHDAVKKERSISQLPPNDAIVFEDMIADAKDSILTTDYCQVIDTLKSVSSITDYSGIEVSKIGQELILILKDLLTDSTIQVSSPISKYLQEDRLSCMQYYVEGYHASEMTMNDGLVQCRSCEVRRDYNCIKDKLMVLNQSLTNQSRTVVQ